MSDLNTAIDAMFAKALDGNSHIKAEMVDSILTERKAEAQDKKAKIVDSISSRMSEHQPNSPAYRALEQCLQALVKA